MSEWRTYKLDNVIDKLIDYRGKTPPKTDSGIPLVTAKIIKSGRILPPTEFLHPDVYGEWMTRGFPQKGDLLVTTEAPLGEVALITDENIALAQRIILLRGKQNVCNTSYLKYYLLSDEGSNQLQSRATGTTVEGIKQSTLRQIDVIMPKYEIQCLIAEALSSLDDKIDLLMRQNTTLEALAQTYFRQWFYEGDSAMTVSEVADLKCVSVNPAKNPLEPFYHYSIPAYDNRRTPAIELGKEILSNKYIVQPNSILISKLNPITPRIWLIGDSVADNSVCSTEFQVLLPKDSKYQLYLYCLMNSYDVVQDFAQSATGTSGSHQRIRPEQIVKTEAVRPDETLLAKFNELCLPMFDKISKNSAQILTLQKLRDTLLPKLISGEVRIKQSEVG